MDQNLELPDLVVFGFSSGFQVVSQKTAALFGCSGFRDLGFSDKGLGLKGVQGVA